MLFIRNYNAKSLDRSSVSMIDKYNARLDKVGELLNNLSSLISNLLSLIRYIRTLLGQSKQRIYNNLDQVKEVIDGNGITGTEATIEAIEDALAAGDEAIDEAEAKLEGIEAAIECNEAYCNDTNVDVSCGEIIIPEACNETTVDDEGCAYCQVSTSLQDEDGNVISSGLCSVCNHEGCNVDRTCNEETNTQVPINGCDYTNITDLSCGQITNIDQTCSEINCTQNCTQASDNCPFTCGHSSDCQQLTIPDNCTYTCIDNGSCNYDESCNECSYSTSCGQVESCNQFDCDQYDCGEPCGETCHMANDEGDCSEGSCGEGEESDDGPCNQYDCSEYDCGEPCGESCGLL